MNNDIYIQVKRYYQGEMSPEERTNWEAKLASDATFSTEVLPYAKMYESIQLKGDQLLKEELLSFGQQLLNATPKAIPKPLYQRTPWLLSIAAGIVLLFSLIFTLTPTQNTDELFAENFQPNFGARGSEASQAPFFEAYNKGAYADAISIYQEELADSPAASQPNIALHLGVSFLAEGQTDAAIATLSRIGKEIPAIYDDAQWFIALTYLKQNELDEAKIRLKLIANDPLQEWSKDAAKLLEDL